MMRVNVGCGASPTPGWLNFDNSPTVRLARWRFAEMLPGRRAFVELARARQIRYARAGALPLPDACADAVYSSHMLEHLDRREAGDFLREAMRVLRSGGILRLAVPDLAKLVSEYSRDGDADRFMAFMEVCAPKPVGLLRRLRYVLLEGFRHHHWMYDERSLRSLLESAGFVDVRALPGGETRIVQPGELDLNERAAPSLYMEGAKP